MNDTIISERISKIIDYVGVSVNAFAKKMGYDRSQVLYDIINNKSKPSFDFFSRFLNSEYSENINLTWLISGKGEMLEKENIKQKPAVKIHSFTSQPAEQGYAPYYFNLALNSELVDLKKTIDQKKPDSWIKFPGIDAEIWFPITGCNMEPKIRTGDIIGVKTVNFNYPLDPDKIYLIITRDDRMIKHLETNDTNKNILWAISENYKRVELNKENIVGIFQIVAINRVF